MYLYFDKMGNLKEQINDEALRQGNSNINKLYVFWEKAVNNANITALWSRFKADDGTYYPSSTTWSITTTTTTETIPYDKNRDLKFFNYFTEYKFYVVTLPDEVLGVSGSWLGTLQFVETNAITTLGQLAFFVSESNSSVEADENINIAQWNYLLLELSEIEGTLTTIYSDYVTRTTNQTITGAKTFTDDITLQNGLHDDYKVSISTPSYPDNEVSFTITDSLHTTEVKLPDFNNTNDEVVTLATTDEIPTKTSDLTNDSNFVTSSDVPTKTSQLTNDSGFITAGSIANMVQTSTPSLTAGDIVIGYGGKNVGISTTDIAKVVTTPETTTSLTENKIIIGGDNKTITASEYSINDIVNTAGGNCSAYSTDLYPLSESSKCVIFGKVSITTKTLASVVLEDTTNTTTCIVANNTTTISPTSENDYHYLYLVYLDINMAEPDYFVYDSVDLNNCNVGDIFYTTDLGYPDYWLQIKPNNALGLDFKLSQLETSTPNLSGYVPTTRKVNNKALSSDITLDATDVGAMSNPMTTQSDIIYGGSSGTPTRLAKGTAGQVLTMNSGATAPEWKTPQNITITTTSGSESVSDGTNTLSFGSNAFNSTTIPSVTTTTGSEAVGSLNVVTRDTSQTITGIKTFKNDIVSENPSHTGYKVTLGTPTYPDNEVSITITDSSHTTEVQLPDFNNTTDKVVKLATTDEIPTKTSDLNNDSGFITGITSSDVTTALGYTPYNSTNPSGYQTSSDVQTAINTALASVYKVQGSGSISTINASLALVTDKASWNGYVYNLIDSGNLNNYTGTTSVSAGDNVVFVYTSGINWGWDKLASDIDLSGYVPTSRKVNNKALTGDITLTASDVGALSSSTTYVSSVNGSSGAITNIATTSDVNAKMSNPMTTQDDIVIGGSSGTPSRLAKGSNNELLGVNNSGNLAYTKGLPYITTAPTSDNTNGGLIIVVLDSEPSTYYDGYYYIITAPQTTGYQVTFTASYSWANQSTGYVKIYDGQDASGTLILDQTPANKSAYPMTLNISSGYCAIDVYGPGTLAEDITSSDYTITSSNGLQIATIDKDGTINIQIEDFND